MRHRFPRYAALLAALLLGAPSAADANARGRASNAKRARPAAKAKAKKARTRRPTSRKSQQLSSRMRHRSGDASRSRRNLTSSRTQRVPVGRGKSVLFVSSGENFIGRIKQTMGWKQSDKVFSLVFIGGAGANSDPSTEKAAVELAQSYARAYKRGEFGDYKLIVASGAAPGLPDAMMEAFAKIAPEVPRVGYSPYKNPKLHMDISPWKNYNFMRMIKPIPNYVAADASHPGYTLRQEAMLQDASMVVAAGGRFGTGEEGFMTLERGKALVLLEEGGGVGVTGGFDEIIERSVRAGKVPLAPVTVTPHMETVKSEAMRRVTDRIAKQSLRSTLDNLKRGPKRHTEQSEARGRSATAKSMINRMKLRNSERAVGKMDSMITDRVTAQASHSRVGRGLQSIRAFARIWQVDYVGTKNGDASPRLNKKRTAEALAKAKAANPKLSDMTMKEVEAAWAAAKVGEQRALTSSTTDRQPYMSLRIGKLDRDRPHVTRLSVADPGPEHAAITAFHPGVRRDKRVIVHHEVINREGSEVQPYRSPKLDQTKRLTYWMAGQAPVSVYLGLPNVPRDLQKALKKNRAEFKKDPASLRARLLTPATDVAANARARFSLGAAEVKVRLSPRQFVTASQMVEFMVTVNEQMGLSGRQPDQVLSAQFNLNEPIINDLGSGKATRVSDPAEVAKLSLQIMRTVQGRILRDAKSKNAAKHNVWRKWAPDSAFEQPGTRTPFIELLGGMRPTTRSGKPTKYSDKQVEQFVRKGTSSLIGMVTEAHENGFETYISAGMDETHMKWATIAGVDGVGIGTALHERETSANKSIMGKLSPELISKALDISAAAESSVLGKGARKLYELSFRKSRGQLRGNAARQYESLFTSMQKLDEAGVAAALKSIR